MLEHINKLRYTIREAGLALGYKPGKVRELVRSGELRAVRDNYRLFVSAGELEKFVKRRESGQPQPLNPTAGTEAHRRARLAGKQIGRRRKAHP